jgi:hypothetical protein
MSELLLQSVNAINTNKSYNVELSDLSLVIITVAAKITNLKFDVQVLINDILKLIENDNNTELKKNTELENITNINTQKKFILHEDIIRIGCNYGEYKSDKYIELTTVVKKSNRGRKKKEKKVSNRKKQGNGKYFNSQITFTILDIIDKTKFYHIKLYTNGTIQIPSVCNENIDSVHYLIDHIIDILNNFDYIKINKEDNLYISYDNTRSTMRNYSFSPIDKLLQIDLKKFNSIIKNFKYYCDNIQYIEKKTSSDHDCINANIYDKYYDELTIFPISQIKFSVEKNAGLVIKFHTPIETKKTKYTTAIIFASGKFSLYGCNDKIQANIIKNILYILISISKDEIIYTK